MSKITHRIEYGTYFSILELISRGKTSRIEIESIIERNIGGYLARLSWNIYPTKLPNVCNKLGFELGGAS